MDNATVSVIIPTTGRESLRRAVQSVIEQSHDDVEAIIVAKESSERIEEIASLDDRVVLVVKPESSGLGGELRQIGTEAASGEFVSYLDDDDMFLPKKIETQLAEAGADIWLIGSRAVLSADGVKESTSPLPAKLFEPGEDLSRYLFWNRSLGPDRNLVHTSTMLLPREAALKIGWRRDLRRHQDWDFVLRGAEMFGTLGIKQVPEALVDLETGTGSSVSSLVDANSSLSWFEDVADIFDDGAAADFLVGQSARYALSSRNWAATKRSVTLARQYGRPSRSAILLMLSAVLPRRSFERLMVSGRRLLPSRGSRT